MTQCPRCSALLAPPAYGMQHCAPCALVWQDGHPVDDMPVRKGMFRSERGFAHWSMRGGSKYTGIVHGAVMLTVLLVLWPVAPLAVKVVWGTVSSVTLAVNAYMLKTGRLDFLDA